MLATLAAILDVHAAPCSAVRRQHHIVASELDCTKTDSLSLQCWSLTALMLSRIQRLADAD